MPQVPKSVGRHHRGGGADDPLGSGFFVWGTYLFKNKYWRKIKIYFGGHFAWLKYFTYYLEPLLTPNYKQHILPPAEVSTLSLSQDAD
jgi:hypothetical protein